MSNIDSILFNNDDGPVSALFTDKGVNYVASQESPRSVKLVTVDAIDSEVLVADSSAPSRSVRFFDVERIEEEKRSQSDHSIESDMIQLLKDRLAQVQTDLSAERAIRKKKDKNMVKLAKELNKRTSEAHVKEAKLHEMASLINDMESKLQNDKRESAQDIQTYRSIFRENETKITELDDSVSKLRRQLLEASSEADRLRSKLSGDVINKSIGYSPVSSAPLTQEPLPRHSYLKIVLALFVSVLSLSIAFAAVNINMDGVCAPVMPGKVITHQVNTEPMLAPWWVHKSLKNQAFYTFCAGRPSTQVSWKGDRMFIHRISREKKKPTVAWKGRAALGVKFGPREFEVNSTRGSKSVKAPWAK